MDYPAPEYTESPSQRVCPPHLLTPQQLQQQQVPFPSPISPGTTFFFPQQQPGAPQPSDARHSLSLNLSGLSMASPQSLSPVAPAQPTQFHPHQLHAHHPIPHHSHSHSHSSASSISGPITPVSPPSAIPLLSSQSQFSFNFDDVAGGLSPDSDTPLSLRRPSTGTHSPSDFAPAKSVPRKRSLTNAHPTSASTGAAAHAMHHHSQSHSYSSSQSQPGLPHPIITTTASSPPLPTSSTSSSSSHPSHSHSHSLSHSHSHSSLSQHPQDISTNPASPYDDLDSGTGFPGIGDDASDDDLASPSGSFSAGGSFTNAKACSSSSQQGSNVAGKSVGTNNFVTKLYHMINDAKSQNFITWTDIGSSFVVSNVGEFSRSILGAHFKHNNFSSFVRQLNMYGFHKINRTPRAQRTSSTSQTWEFSHPKFLRGRADLLEAIKRKALEPDPRERSRVELPGEVARLLSELREENRTLWREIKSLSSRVPQSSPTANHGPATMSQNVGGSTQGSQGHISHNVALGGGHVLTHSRSSSNLGGDDADVDWEDEDGMSASALTGIGMGGSQGGEEWDAQSPSFNFGAGTGSNAPSFTFNGLGSSGDEWKRWAEGEISKERKRVEKLVGIVKALVDVAGKSGISGAPSNVGIDREHHPIPPSILQELHELSLTFDNSSSPVSMPIPSPSPSPSPHPWTRHPHSPNIYITSPTSPTPYGGSSHSRSPSRDSQTHSNPNSHTSPPTLSIPDSVTACSSQSFHSPLSSPTTSDIMPSFVSQRLGHARSRSQLGPRTQRQPNITFTPDSDDGRVEKRARTDKVQDGMEGLRMGEEMDIVPSDVAEDVKLSSTLSLTGGPSTMTNPGVGVDPGAGGIKMGLRSRSDSAPMWGADGSSVQGGLSANWMGRGRSGGSFGQ